MVCEIHHFQVSPQSVILVDLALAEFRGGITRRPRNPGNVGADAIVVDIEGLLFLFMFAIFVHLLDFRAMSNCRVIPMSAFLSCLAGNNYSP